MAYRFELDESLADGVRRIGCEQIDEAIQQLSKNRDPHKGIHEARKSLKRLRALLRLARPALRKEDYVREYRSFRDIGRELSKARDAQAMVEAINKMDHAANAEAKAGAKHVTDWLEQRRGKVLRGLDKGPKDVLVGSLRDARRRFGQLRVKGGFTRISKGLQRSYRDGRRAFARAYAMGQDEDFHEWRKGVQQHWRHMQLLQAAWPETLQPRIELTKELSQLLGDDQDMHLLRRKLEDQNGLAHKREVDAFLASCSEMQHRLRAEAEPRGQRLFVERPKAFRERMAACWRTARKLSRSDGQAATKAETTAAPKPAAPVAHETRAKERKPASKPASTTQVKKDARSASKADSPVRKPASGTHKVTPTSKRERSSRAKQETKSATTGAGSSQQSGLNQRRESTSLAPALPAESARREEGKAKAAALTRANGSGR